MKCHPVPHRSVSIVINGTLARMQNADNTSMISKDSSEMQALVQAKPVPYSDNGFNNEWCLDGPNASLGLLISVLFIDHKTCFGA